MTGTIKWSIEDDGGKAHTFRIPHSYYVPHAGVRLLSPQHWAKQFNDSIRFGTGEETVAHQCILFWDNRNFTKTIPLSPRTSNVATMYQAAGFQGFHAFCAEASINDDEDEQDPIVMDSEAVSNDEEDIPSSTKDDDYLQGPQPDPTIQRTPREFDLDLNNSEGVTPVVIEDDDKDRQPTNVAAEFLKYHINYCHASPARLQEMAKQVIIPRHLATCNVPICSACQYGKATRRPWRNKTRKDNLSVTKVRRPGQTVGIDQMISKTPGLIAQMRGFLLRQRYMVCTVFVDHFSNLSYVHLQKSTSAADTIEAKLAFERYALQHGVSVQHYHADNCVFATKDFVDHCITQQQALTFASVNAHHQNGKAEVRIRHLQEQARTMLIHANKRWPEAITANLWPYAIRMANDSINATPWLQDSGKRSPLEIFSGSKVTDNPKHWYHFGCPVYILDDNLQQGQRP